MSARMCSITLLAVLAIISELDQDACRADLISYPADVRGTSVRYLSLEAVPKKHFLATEAALKFAVVSASREVVIDRLVPERLPNSTAYRIQLQYLNWDWRDWNKLMERYPYQVNDPQNPIKMIRGDWLLTELSDPTQSDAYYRLLYGGEKIPKTVDDFLKFWGIDRSRNKGIEFGWIESKSQVGKQGTRFIRHLASERGSAWETRDTLRIDREKDPLEFPQGDAPFDGTELIAQIPKISVAWGSRGALQVYLLANGKGQVVNEAPVALVEDYTRFKGQTAIRTNGSCVQCHIKGINPSTENGIAALIREGVQLYANSVEKQEFVERFHLGDVVTQIKRDQEDYAVGVFGANGLTVEQNAGAWKRAIGWYISDVTLDQAAQELGSDAEQLKLALAYASASKIDPGNRLAALAHGRAMPRTQFESDFKAVEKYLSVWRQRK